MTKPMTYRKLTTLLKQAGFTSRQGKGDHEIWSNGPFSVSITQAREISPGLTRKALKTIEASKRNTK